MRLNGLFVGAAMSLFVAGAAQAMPVGSAPASDARPGVTLVRDGCGYGMYRNAWGHCRDGRGWRGGERPGYDRGWRGAERRGYDRPRRWCPPGMHRIPGTGVCRRNYY